MAHPRITRIRRKGRTPIGAHIAGSRSGEPHIVEDKFGDNPFIRDTTPRVVEIGPLTIDMDTITIDSTTITVDQREV